MHQRLVQSVRDGISLEVRDAERLRHRGVLPGGVEISADLLALYRALMSAARRPEDRPASARYRAAGCKDERHAGWPSTSCVAPATVVGVGGCAEWDDQEGAIQSRVAVSDLEIRLARERRSKRSRPPLRRQDCWGIGLEAQRCRGCQRAKGGGQLSPSDTVPCTSSRWRALLPSKRSTWISAGSVARSARPQSWSRARAE